MRMDGSMPAPATPRRYHSQTEIYGVYKRTAARTELDPTERDERDFDEAWDLRHEALADWLDTFVGKVVSLKSEKRSVLDDVYPAGMRFKVVGRVKDKLLGTYSFENEEGEPETAVLLLKPLWVEVMVDGT